MQIVKEISNNIVHCKQIGESLRNEIVEYPQLVQWFKEFCAALIDLILSISTYIKEIVHVTNKQQWEPFLLYLTQLTAVLSLLIDTLVLEVDIQKPITEARCFVIKQVNWCLEKLQECISFNGKVELDTSVGSFLKAIDFALDKINELNPDDVERPTPLLDEIRGAVEEVLTHAMSVAQVTADDCNIIKGSCQIVLESLESLTDEFLKSTHNSAMCRLFLDFFNDKLCALERRVNTAVLRLCLKVFSEYTQPLEQLQEFCRSHTVKYESELDSLVANFDLHVDRLMQIGFFAVSCSSNVNKVVQMKSCLVSLEALEIELVPALTAMTLDKSEQIVSYAKLLENYWKQQAKLLKEYVYCIIDPVAFVQVIYDDLKNNVDQLKINEMIKEEDILAVTEKGQVLVVFMQTTVNEFAPSEISVLRSKTRNVKIAIHELKSAANSLLNDGNSENNTSRVLKRCKLLLNMIKQLKVCIQNENLQMTASITSEPADIEEKLQIESNGFQNNFFDHIIQRGKDLLKERSLLNVTPQKSKTQSTVAPVGNKEISLYKLVHLKRMQFTNMRSQEKPMDQQVSDMLSDISNLSKSLV